MTKAPEQIWLDGDVEVGDGYFPRCFEDRKPCSEPAISYTRTDVAQAMVAAAHDVMAQLADSRRDACGLDQDGNPYVSEEAHIFGGNVADNIACNIRALTPTDAKAALDRIVQKAVQEALQVKPLVWGYHPMGQMASTGMGTAYIIDTRDAPRIRWGKWPGGHGPERETLAEMQYAAQADYEARILSALKGGEA